jgi:hypothetical protein
MPGPNNVAALQQYQDNLVRLLIATTQQITNPTQSGIDAMQAAYAAAAQAGKAVGIVVAEPDYSMDGESYQWAAYREGLERSVREAQRLIVLLSGSYITRSYGQV